MFTPAIVKILKYLKESQLKRTEEEMAFIIAEAPEYVNRALTALDAAGIVKQEKGSYSYQTTPANEKLRQQLLEVYQILDQKPTRQLLMRGLICQVPSQYLFHAKTLIGLLEEAGIEPAEIEEFLASEVELGYLKKVRLLYIGLEPSFIPICIPPYYFYYLYHLGFIDQEKHYKLKQKYPEEQFQEEDYLIVQYPTELATPAKEYLERERGDLREMLRHKALSNWGEVWWQLRHV
jgi:hypothetical protein